MSDLGNPIVTVKHRWTFADTVECMGGTEKVYYACAIEERMDDGCIRTFLVMNRSDENWCVREVEIQDMDALGTYTKTCIEKLKESQRRPW